MDEFERKIAEALRREDAEQFASLGADQPIHQMLFDTFRGRRRWINALLMLPLLACFAGAVWCAVCFFGTSDVHAMLAWGFAGILLMMAVGMLKLWWWLEMQKNSIVREVKRVELQVASLAARLAE
ncbi:MAG: hypothetical protein IPJ41_05640 [Phycisphaerales bacterium]|nr:hypothetical protein [Phycisphaerales bacterium]